MFKHTYKIINSFSCFLWVLCLADPHHQMFNKVCSIKTICIGKGTASPQIYIRYSKNRALYKINENWCQLKLIKSQYSFVEYEINDVNTCNINLTWDFCLSGMTNGMELYCWNIFCIWALCATLLGICFLRFFMSVLALLSSSVWMMDSLKK